jgi:homoserine kinase
MNTLSRTARLISAFAAATITLTLLHTVFAIAEPQRSVLIAKMERADRLAATRGAMAMAATADTKTTK